MQSYTPELLKQNISEERRSIIHTVLAAAKKNESVLLVGPPGSGKTSIAKYAATRLDPINNVNLQIGAEVVALYHMARLGPGPEAGTRPFRAPHHTASSAGMLGNGRMFRPGELTLAHGGVLFLDDVAEFPRAVLHAVAEVQQTGKVTYNAEHLRSLPAKFMLIAATSHCPCGLTGSRRNAECTCNATAVRSYHERYSMLKFDHKIFVPKLTDEELKRT